MIYNIYAARENINDFISHKVFKKENISTLDDLGNTFAKHCSGAYTTDFDSITKEIEQTKKDTIIVVFSAGNIDYQLRKYFEK